ncbi:MAG: hypothetical protein V3V92_05425 [Candidatus Hydrothermarchaeales archaeon]
MKAWQKGAIIGGVWGLISVFFVIMAMLIEFGHHQSLTSKIEEIIFSILFLPGVIGMTLLDKLAYPALALILIFILSPLIGALIVYSIGRIITPSKKD